MIYLILSAFVYFIPGLWVNYTLNKHNDVLPNMPFTAKEFGEQLLKEKGLVSRWKKSDNCLTYMTWVINSRHS